MKISLNFSAVRQTKWSEYIIRFIAGGLVTVLAGVVAKKFGPAIGGIFLAFPAVFSCSVTLVEKHEQERKQGMGRGGTSSGTAAAGYDASGAAMGGIGLLVFAVLVWRSLGIGPAWAVLAGATCVWCAVSFAVWRIFRKQEDWR
jgi:hypothetical protein